MSRSAYEVVSLTGDVITIRDLNGRVSVTNDAEAVVSEVIQWKGRVNEQGQPWRIHYYDSEGNLDQLLHSNGQFNGFAPVQKEGRR